MRPNRNALAGLLAALLMASCAQVSPVVPEALLRPCRAVAGPLATNGDLLSRYIDVRNALQECDDDKTALRDWASTLKD